MKERKARSDSTESALNLIKATSVEILPPDGVVLRNDDEMIIWKQFVKARAVSDWRDMDLLLLAKVVRVEADIRKYQEMVDRAGPLIKNKRETLIENPLIRVIDTYQRQQLAIIRSMSLNNQGSDARTLQSNATDEQSARETIKNQGAFSLLASPMQ
jgi:hypothetical protein